MSARPGPHERLRAAIAAGLLAYLAVGMAQLGPDDRERTHLFPVFAWNMYSFVPPRGPFSLHVTRDGGKPLSSAPALEDYVALRWPERKADAAHMANTLCESVALSEIPRVEAARKAIEGRFLDAPCEYEAFEDGRSIGRFACLPEDD